MWALFSANEIPVRGDGHSYPLIGRVRAMGRMHGHGSKSRAQTAGLMPGADHRPDSGREMFAASASRLHDRGIATILHVVFIEGERSLGLERIGHRGGPVGTPGPMPSRRRMTQWLHRKNRGRE